MENSIVLNIISLIIAAASSVFSFIALYQTNIQRKKETQDFLFDNTIGITSFLADAYTVLSNKKFCDTHIIETSDKELVIGFHRLYSYGKANRLYNLCEFATIHTSNNTNNIKCFAFLFFSFENDYLKFRKSKIGLDVTIEDEKYLNEAIKTIRLFIDVCSSYALTFLFKRKTSKKETEKYYRDLSNFYIIKEKKHANKN